MKRDGERLFGLGLAIGLMGLSAVAAAEQAGTAQAGAATQAPAATAPSSDVSGAETPSAPPTVNQMRQAITQYVKDLTDDEGAFYVEDEVTGETRELTLEQVHDQIGKGSDVYYACADMKDVKSAESVDVDFDVEPYDNELEVIDVRIHQVNGKARYTYDDKGNRLPVTN